MKITFKINYRTNYGQQILIEGIPGQGTSLLTPKANGDWELTIDLGNNPPEFSYRYLMKDNNQSSTLYEFGMRQFKAPKLNTENLYVHDYWRPTYSPEVNTFYSSALKDVIFKRQDVTKPIVLESSTPNKIPVRVSIPVIRISPEHYLAVKFIAAMPEDNVVIPLSNSDFPIWSAEFELARPKQYAKYKYCIYEIKTKKMVLEEYVTRYFQPTSTHNDTFYILNDEDFKFPRYPWKSTGVAIPVFSLRSTEGFGVGEFADLIPLIDWAKKVGLRMIQILPINDTVKTHTFTDSYPYSCVSVFALHPIYLRIKDMGELPSELSEEIFEERRQALNKLHKIDYETVMNAKSRFFKMLYDENKRAFLKEPAYKEFFNKNSSWLKPYAVFSYLRDLYGTPDYSRWGKFAVYNPEKIDELCKEDNPDYDDVAVHLYIQYHLHLQLSKVAEYARKNGIVLKGDIPIGIDRFSVDAWVSPNLYHIDQQAGAPPDDFSDDGQNWRFPTYNWDEMAKDGFAWWKARLKNMAQYFDAYRIDHILGFFRIWSIPRTQTRGIMGVFDPAVPINAKEFADRGIQFDYDRFCRPYIREYMLNLIFNDHAGYVKHAFLDKTDKPDEYRFKPEFDTQVKINQAFAEIAVPTTEDMLMFQKIKHGLLYLVSDVLFFADTKNPGAYHPRHSLFKTYSYKDLDTQTKQAIFELYNDYFFNRNETLWKQQAEIKLPELINATEMLVCGEDLGMIPACVPEVMKNLNILSLEIQRMPKENAGGEFGRPNTYPYMSVATTSSHDTLPIRGWWEEDRERAQRFYNNMLGKSGPAPFYCETEVVKDIIKQHLFSPSMWAIFPIQDFLGLSAELRYQDPADERVNVPANENHYWRYRCHISVEQLLAANSLNSLIQELVNLSGRNVAY